MAANEYELVRVKDDTSGHEFTTTRAIAEGDGLTVLKDRDATDDFGRPLPAKVRTEKGATPKKES